mgnify:CR=1 FL=1
MTNFGIIPWNDLLIGKSYDVFVELIIFFAYFSWNDLLIGKSYDGDELFEDTRNWQPEMTYWSVRVTTLLYHRLPFQNAWNDLLIGKSYDIVFS